MEGVGWLKKVRVFGVWFVEFICCINFFGDFIKIVFVLWSIFCN